MNFKRDEKILSNNTLSDLEYRSFTAFLEEACGIVLGANKHYLVTSRLKCVMADNKISSMSDLMDEMNKDRSARLRGKIIESMTTNETSWFRDSQPFEVLKRNILPEIVKQKKDRVRIWSAACSSGQEPYSIGITLHEYQLGNPGALTASHEIIATDISPEMLGIARSGIYDSSAIVRGMSAERKTRYFQKSGDDWEVNRLVRANIQFRELNLLQSYALLGRFDVIFCRNVLIYFSRESKQNIVDRMASVLNPGGYLILGGSESMTNVSERFVMEKLGGCVLYRVKT